MKNVIKVEIYHDGEFYCGRCLDFDVFTQGSTLDDLVLNIKEAIELHFEDDAEALSDYRPHPSIFTMMDLGELHA